MDGQLKLGTELKSQSGNTYKVEKLLGAGGQGEVYEVTCAGRHMALKWYYPRTATEKQKEILEDLISIGAPDKSFLWPEDLIFRTMGESFGYIMPLRPKNFKNIVDLMKRRVEPNFYALTKAAYNLTQGYQQLHLKGRCYCDISFGNVFFDPDTGDVLICDNDNVVPNGEAVTVMGTPRFMAPEIVTGADKPNRNTDQYSLAVLLFYMLMMGHPLEGALEAKIRCMDAAAMTKLYGTNPVFIFDPNDTTNRPVPDYQDNPKIFWGIFPQALKDLFITSFTVGLTKPHSRVTEKEWLKVLANMLACMTECKKCTAEVYYDEAVMQANRPHVCWNCRSAVEMPVRLEVGRNRVLLEKGKKICSHTLNGDLDLNTVWGTVVANPKNPAILGIHNESNVAWTFIKADGSRVPVDPGRNVTVSRGGRIQFGSINGEMK